jgi:hypothetical protein
MNLVDIESRQCSKTSLCNSNHRNQFLVVGYDSLIHEHTLLTPGLQSVNMLSRSGNKIIHIIQFVLFLACPPCNMDVNFIVNTFMNCK